MVYGSKENDLLYSYFNLEKLSSSPKEISEKVQKSLLKERVVVFQSSLKVFETCKLIHRLDHKNMLKLDLLIVKQE